MLVFDLPTFPMCSSSSDHFPPQKDTTREQVAKCLRSAHDQRVGRMAGHPEYWPRALPRERFSEALMAEIGARMAQPVGDQRRRWASQEAIIPTCTERRIRCR